MEYKTLGKTGLKVSRMGFGGIPIQKIDEEGTRKLLQDMVKDHRTGIYRVGRKKQSQHALAGTGKNKGRRGNDENQPP